MGQSGNFQMMYGWHLSEEDIEKIENKLNEDDDDWLDDVIDDWAKENGLDLDVGGDPAYDWNEYIVGVKIGPWMMDLGVMEVDDDYGEVDKSVYDKLQPYVKYFGREPRKYLVMSYG